MALVRRKGYAFRQNLGFWASGHDKGGQIPNCLYSNSINIVRLVSKKENKSLILRLSQTEL